MLTEENSEIKDTEDFIAAMKEHANFPLNWVAIYLPKNDILYSLVGGLIPTRQNNLIQGSYPKIGKLAANKWLGLVPKNEMPYVINPDRGYVVSANNFVSSSNVLHGISHTFTYTGRSSRINELLWEAIKRTGGKVTPLDMEKIQTDVVDIQARMSYEDIVYCAKLGKSVLAPDE